MLHPRITQKEFNRRMNKHERGTMPLSWDREFQDEISLGKFNGVGFGKGDSFFPYWISRITFDSCSFESGKLAQFRSQDNNDMRKGLYFSDCTFRNVRMGLLDFELTTFERCTFLNCNFYNSTFNDANFSTCSIIECELSDSNWWGASINSSNFVFSDANGYQNLVVLGQDNRNYQFWMAASPDNVATIYAGCQEHVGFTSARRHWQRRARSYYNAMTPIMVLGYLKMGEAIAMEREWKLDPDEIEADDYHDGEFDQWLPPYDYTYKTRWQRSLTDEAA